MFLNLYRLLFLGTSDSYDQETRLHKTRCQGLVLVVELSISHGDGCAP